MTDEQILKIIRDLPNGPVAHAYRLGRKLANMELAESMKVNQIQIDSFSQGKKEKR